MLNINTPKTKYASNKHLEGLKEEILLQIISVSNNPKNKLEKRKFKILEEFIQNNIEKILVGNQTELIDLNSKVNKLAINSLQLYSVLNLIFNYKRFRSYKKKKYGGFILAKNLSIETCPYCNRNYTTSTKIDKKSKNIFPAFDHFLPQDKYPLLVLSFYNLIPTCTVCNTTKSNINPLVEKILYPYDSNDYINNFKFQLQPKSYVGFTGKSDDFSINLKTDPLLSPDEIEKIKKTIGFFDVIDILEGNHKDIINEIIWKSINYNDAYRKQLKKAFNFNENEIYRFAFDTYYEDYKFKKRPFSKLKRDIFEDLKS